MILGASSPVTPHGIAYVSDVSRPDRLATNMGILQGLGYFLGLLTGALLSLAVSEGTTGKDPVEGEAALDPYDKLFNISYGVGLGFAALTGFIMLVFLPESLAAEERTQHLDWRKANPLGFVSLITQNAYLSCLWVSAIFAWIAVGAGESVTAGWWLRRYTQSEVSLFIMFAVMLWLSSALGAAIMTPILVKLFGLKGSIHFSMLFTMSVGIAFAFAPTVNLSYIAVGLSFFASPVVPTELSLIMGQVPATQKGALAGALRSSEALSKLIGITLFGNLFADYIAEFQPDVSCVPLDYSSANPVNTCECGVATCPTYDATNSSGRVASLANPFYYEAATCSLGWLSPKFTGKPSKYVDFRSPEPNPIVPQLFIDSGLVTRDDTCQGGGGMGNSISLELEREWCVAASALEASLGEDNAKAYNTEYGCPGFDFGAWAVDSAGYTNEAVCDADPGSTDCDSTLYTTTTTDPDAYYTYNTTEFAAYAGIVTNITSDTDAECASYGTAELNFCWEGVIAALPGLFPLLYLTGLGGLSYTWYIIAEVFFKKYDREYWIHKDEEGSPEDAAINPIAD